MPSSGYTAISFTAGEQPTTAKWNLVGSNDASFNNGNGFNDGIIVARHLGASAVTSVAIASTMWFGNMSALTLTPTLATAASVTLPTYSVPHNFLIIANFEFNNNAGTGGDFVGQISNGSTALQSNVWSALNGAYFNTIPVTTVFSSTGGVTINFQANKAGTNEPLTVRSTYTIIDLGTH